jgi:hypothetical protein
VHVGQDEVTGCDRHAGGLRACCDYPSLHADAWCWIEVPKTILAVRTAGPGGPRLGMRALHAFTALRESGLNTGRHPDRESPSLPTRSLRCEGFLVESGRSVTFRHTSAKGDGSVCDGARPAAPDSGHGRAYPRSCWRLGPWPRAAMPKGARLTHSSGGTLRSGATDHASIAHQDHLGQDDLDVLETCRSGVAQAGRRLNPALRRYLGEWRVRDTDEIALRLAEAEALAPEPKAAWRVADRLTAEQEHAIVADFLAGVAKPKLAERYDISLSSVKRILRRHGVRRRHRYDYPE